MHFTDKQYLNEITTKPYDMHDLKVNFDKFHHISQKYLSNDFNSSGNVQFYRNPPLMSDSEIIALSICQEALGIDSEFWFHSKLKSDYHIYFPHLPHITRYNFRRKRLAPWIQKLNEAIAAELNEGEIFLLSIPCLFLFAKMRVKKDSKLVDKYLKKLRTKVILLSMVNILSAIKSI